MGQIFVYAARLPTMQCHLEGPTSSRLSSRLPSVKHRCQAISNGKDSCSNFTFDWRSPQGDTIPSRWVFLIVMRRNPVSTMAYHDQCVNSAKTVRPHRHRYGPQPIIRSAGPFSVRLTTLPVADLLLTFVRSSRLAGGHRSMPKQTNLCSRIHVMRPPLIPGAKSSVQRSGVPCLFTIMIAAL